MESKECYAGTDNEHTEQLEALKSPKKRSKRNVKQRFTDEQIRSLESIFNSQTKLEPRKKAELASELGLQPRQVAIWFQNRRARCRSKQTEQEYNVLKAKYDALSSQFESLNEETQSLLIQLQALNDKLEEAYETNRDKKNIKTQSIDGNLVTKVKDNDLKAAPSFTFELEEDTVMLSHDSRNRKYGYSTKDALGYLNISDSEGCSLASIDGWSSEFDSNNLFEQSTSTTNWSDFWT